MLRVWSAWVLVLGCVPEGIRYPNPMDAGPSTDAEAPDDAGPVDTGPDGGPAGRLVVTANGAAVDQGATFDFGPIVVGNTRAISFAIENGTSAAVSLIGAPLVAISGAGAASFTVAQPTSAFIAAGGSASFMITANPTTLGGATATIDIVHAEGSYTFGIATAGRQPGIWVGVGANGRRALSLDGTTWTNEQTFGGMDDSNLFRSVGFGNGVFVACGGGQNGLLYWSENGIDWTDISDTVGWFGGAAWGNGVFVGVGANGRILTSINGRNWGDGDVDFEQHFRAVAFGNGEFVLVGDGGRRRSTADGINFTPNVLGGDRFTAVAFAGDRFIAVGLNGRRAVTLDGETWVFDVTAPDGLGFFDVAYGNNTAVAVGGIGVVVSFDGGETWDQYRDGPLMNAVTFGNGMFVGTGDVDGVAFSSADGVTWTRHDNAGAAGFTKIAYGE